MIKQEELADGIVQIHCRGVLDTSAWQGVRETVRVRAVERHAPLYVLLNLRPITTVDPIAFGELVTATVFNDTALTVMVARRAHIHMVREIISTYPDRDHLQLRVLPRLDEALQALLDRQALDRMQGVNRFGH
ncbi:MAG: hypothetical protein AAF787_16160 [Chloroflexota bacterium]